MTWNGKKAQAGNNALNESVQTKLGACREKIGAKATVGATEDFERLQEELKEVIKLLKEFKGEQRPSLKLFAFWEDYGTMVQLLLQFIKAERTGNWKLHLFTVAAMTPYFFTMDRQNYALWHSQIRNLKAALLAFLKGLQLYSVGF